MEPNQTIYDYDRHFRLAETDSRLQMAPETFGSRQIGLAIVGVGRMGTIHLYNVLREPRARLLYIMDADAAKLDFLERKYFLSSRGVRTLTLNEWEVILEDKEVEALLISTPTSSHESYCRAGLEHNKHIICEKPLAKEASSVGPLLALAREKKLTLICATNRRYDPDFRFLKQQVEANQLGPLRLIKTCSRQCPPASMEYIRTSGGVFQDTCVHDVDIILWLAQELPVEVHAQGVAHSPAYKEAGDFDTVVFTMRFKSGLISITDLSRLSGSGYEQRLELFGPNGVLKVDEHPPAHWEKHNQFGCLKPNQHYSFASRYREAYANEISELFNHIEGFAVMEPRNELYLPALNKVIGALEESARERAVGHLNWSDQELECFAGKRDC